MSPATRLSTLLRFTPCRLLALVGLCPSSLPGLTRQSMVKCRTRGIAAMDGAVKPAHDEAGQVRYKRSRIERSAIRDFAR